MTVQPVVAKAEWSGKVQISNVEFLATSKASCLPLKWPHPSVNPPVWLWCWRFSSTTKGQDSRRGKSTMADVITPFPPFRQSPCVTLVLKVFIRTSKGQTGRRGKSTVADVITPFPPFRQSPCVTLVLKVLVRTTKGKAKGQNNGMGTVSVTEVNIRRRHNKPEAGKHFTVQWWMRLPMKTIIVH